MYKSEASSCHRQKSYRDTEYAGMDKKRQEKRNERKNLDEFNAVTEKVKPENQNQDHNVREEAIGPVRSKR